MPKETLRRAHHFFDMAMRDALRNPRLLEALLGIYYREWVERLDFAAATFEPRSYTMPELRGMEADVVCRIPCRSGPEGAYAIVYLLLEHQSKPDFWIVFRLVCYMVAIWLEQYRELLKLESKERLKPIIPLVFYTGTRRWTAPLTLKSLIEGGEEFAQFIPEFEPLFLGLRDATDEQLKAAGAFGMALRALKRIDAKSAEVLPLLEQAVKALETVVGPQLRDLALLITRLVSYRRPPQDYNELQPLFERLRVQAPEVMDMFKTHADTLFEEGLVKGREEGAQKGRQEGEQKGLQEGLQKGQMELILRLGRRKFGEPSAEQLARLQSIAAPDRLLALSDRLLDSESWDDLLE